MTKKGKNPPPEKVVTLKDRLTELRKKQAELQSLCDKGYNCDTIRALSIVNKHIITATARNNRTWKQ